MAGLLCLIAHPDDELFCAGLLCKLSRRGIPVHVCLLTRGEGGECGNPPFVDQGQLGDVREREMKNAGEALGISGLTFLDYTDPRPEGRLKPPTHDFDTLRSEIQGVIKRVVPEVVLTHGSNGDYGHPAHVLVNRVTLEAVKSLRDDHPLVYTFCAAFANPGPRNIINPNDWADVVIDISHEFEGVVQAAYSHKTQWGTLFGNSSNAPYSRIIDEKVRSSPFEAYRRCWSHGEDSGDVLMQWLGINNDSRVSTKLVDRLNKYLFKFRHLLRRVK